MKEEVIISVSNPTKSNIFLKRSLFILSILVISLLSVFIGLWQFKTPEIIPENAAKDQFSAERAVELLDEIAVKPRPIGSPEHDRIRDYLLSALTDLGVSPKIQIVEDNLTVRGVPYEGKVENIVARISGEDSSGAIMITSHYDSEVNSPGAADAGSGVVAILETVRALTESPHLKNDLIILISDGEEIGLLGAQAFVQEHPWAKDVDIVLNFEARGSGGPSVLFETNDENERLVAEFAKAATNPITHSFIYDLYRTMPNDTDLSIYKSFGMYGLNFGFFVGLFGYHTPEDTVENLNKGSLQHHGDNMLDLVHHFGNMDLIAQKDGKSLYFNVLGKKVVTYSEKYVIPIMILAFILFVVTFLFGYTHKRITIVGAGIGFLLFLLIIVLAFFAGESILACISIITNADKWTISAYPTISNPVFIAIILIVFSLMVAIYYLVLKRINATDLTIGGFFGWFILVFVSSMFFKGSSYVFVWPFIIGVISLNFYLYLKEEFGIKGKLLALGMIIPPLILTVPIIYLVFALLTLQHTGILISITSLLIIFLIPALNQIQKT